MKQTFKYLTIFTLGVLMLSSCEKETYFDYQIENRSSSTITVNGSEIHGTTISQTIAVNKKSQITHWSKRGKQTDLLEPTTIFGNDLVVINSSGDTLRKDYKLLTNWTSNVDDNRGTASHSYILIVTDSDF